MSKTDFVLLTAICPYFKKTTIKQCPSSEENQKYYEEILQKSLNSYLSNKKLLHIQHFK